MLRLPCTDLINRLQPKAPSETRAIEEIAQLSRDQDVKIKDCVGPILSRDHSHVCDQGKDCEAQSDTRPHDDSHEESRFEAARRGQDHQMISQSGAVLRRMHWLNLLGQTETKLDYVLGRTTAKLNKRHLQTRVSKMKLDEAHSPRPCSESPAPHSSEQTDGQHPVLLGVY